MDTLKGKTAVITDPRVASAAPLRCCPRRKAWQWWFTGQMRRVLIEAVDTIKQAGGCAAYFLGDVAGDGFGTAVTAFATREFGGVDIMIANAGAGGLTPFLEMSAESMRRTLDVHVTGAFLPAQAAARHMVETGKGGRILLMSSVSGLQALFGYAAYASAKAAMMSMARVAAVELLSNRLKVCT